MLDSEKIELIGAMIADWWEGSNICEDSAVTLINAITVVVDFKRKENT